MADMIPFDLVSPERLLLSEEAEMVTLPGADGYFGVLPGHAPVISTLKPGVIEVQGGPAGNARYFVSAGFAEVTASRLTVLAEDVIAVNTVDAATLDKKIADADEDILQARTDAARAKAVATLDTLKQLRAAL
ncbi:MAG: F0F1 ATP synthase subunit epsilon [Pseudomonadota bacterium]|nr:F0F1 ATP synthase subunit epsilon [Pseudomonadota bacterium]